MKKLVSILLASSFFVLLTLVSTASPDSVTVISDTSVITYNTLGGYAPLGDPAWGAPRQAVKHWIHPEWKHGYSEPPYPASASPSLYRAEVDGAEWISTGYQVDGRWTWRRFTKKDIELCPEASNIKGDIWVDADDRAEIYVNEEQIGYYAQHGQIIAYPFTVPDGTDTLTLDFLVQNTGGCCGWYHNPTGLIFKAEITYECVVPVQIDIKPGSDPSSWPCNRTNDDLPVAILSTADFDATSVNADSVRFGKSGTEAAEVHQKDGMAKRHEEDVNKDGLKDLVFHFRFGDTGFSCADLPDGENEVTLDAKLTGEANGTPIQGEDSLRLVKE